MNMIARFLEYLSYERHYSPATVHAYGHDLEQFVAYLGQDTDSFSFALAKEDDIRMWMVSLMDQGLSARSVKRKLSSLSSYAKFCLKMGYADVDVTRKVISPKADKPLPVFYKESEMNRLREGEQFADDFLGKRDNLILEMLYQTGMRQAEMLGLNDNDVDTVSMQVRVFGKRRKERLIPIGNPLKEQIEEYLAYRQEQVGPTQDHCFFCNAKGQRLNRHTLYNVVHQRMSEVSTLKKQSPHVLRHTFATTMLNNGADIQTIKTLMGHASLAATQVYTHTTFEQIRKEYNSAHPRSKK